MICISYLKWRPSLRSRMGAELLGLCTQKWFIKKTKYFAQFRNLLKKNECMNEWIDWWSGMNECVCTCCECEWRERAWEQACQADQAADDSISISISIRLRFDGAECASESIGYSKNCLTVCVSFTRWRCLPVLPCCMLHVANEAKQKETSEMTDIYIEYDNVECECECDNELNCTNCQLTRQFERAKQAKREWKWSLDKHSVWERQRERARAIEMGEGRACDRTEPKLHIYIICMHVSDREQSRKIAHKYQNNIS